MEACLRQSFEDVLDSRRVQLADRIVDIDRDKALKELLPLAQNYLSSEVFRRLESALRLASGVPRRLPRNEAGLWSELSFRLRRPLGILTGTIDKLFVSPSHNGAGFDVEIIDFKTNRFSSLGSRAMRAQQQSNSAAVSSRPLLATSRIPPGSARARIHRPGNAQQFVFDFSAASNEEGHVYSNSQTDKIGLTEDTSSSLEDQIHRVAADYQLQLQAYALALYELAPALLSKDTTLRVTLHFLDPNREFQLDQELLEPSVSARAVDDAIAKIISATEPQDFPVRPAAHCRMCNFLGICSAGSEWLRRDAHFGQ